MTIQLRLFQVLVSLLIGPIVLAQIAGSIKPAYSFKQDGINIMPWNKNDLTLEQGIQKIGSLDQWFTALSEVDKNKQAMNYALNRNRLFLVAQEKRLATELSDMIRLETDSTAISQAQENFNLIRSAGLSLLEDREVLSSQVFKDLDGVSVAYQTKNGAKAPRGFSTSISKSIGGNIDGFGSSHQFREKSLGDILDTFGLRQKWKDYQAMRKEISPERKINRIVVNSNFVRCSPSGSYKQNPFDVMKFPQSADFLKQLGINEWAETVKARDLSSWYGPNETQIENGVPNAKCMALAIASEMGAVFNQKHTHRNITISSDQTYAMLTRMENAETPHDLKSVDYCDLSKYLIEPFRGIESLIGSLSALSKQPVCTVKSSEQKDSRGLYSVKKFSAFELPAKSK
jgi:hypothetical protein